MRVVFAPIPGIGHAFPMVPLAWGLIAAGHEVTFLAGADALEVRHAGVPVVDPIPGVTMEQDFAAFAEEAPDILASMAHLSLDEILDLKPMIVKPWDRYVDRYVAAMERLEPDLVVHDPVYNAGLIAAAKLDVPAIGHGFGLVRFTAGFLREHAAEGFERHGVELPKRTGLIDVAPAALMEPGPARWHMRYVPYNGAGVLPSWLPERPRRPRIAITLGTVSARVSGGDRLANVLEAVRDVDAEFALTVGEEDAAALGPLPGNVRATGWVPLHRLLPACSAIIHHGGSGTMLTAGVTGIPQLIVPEGADNDYNGRILAGYGCALTASPGKVRPAMVEALLADEGLRAAARELRAEIERMPAPAELIDDIVEFAR